MKTAVWMVLAALLIPFAAAQEEPSLKIKHIDVVMLSHLDVGFNDQQYVVVNELRPRFLDVALDAALATANEPPGQCFRWTEESLLPVLVWWRNASPERRRLMLRMVDDGQIAMGAMPFNTIQLENADEWQRVVHWVPEDLWQELHLNLAIQDDVNGMSRAGMTALADRGIRRLLMGINPTNGGPPFPAPTAFWWKLPDGRRIFVYVAAAYSQASDLFLPGGWWRVGGGPPSTSDLAFRPPRPGEILSSDDASVRAANDYCLKRLAALEKRGYVGDRLIAIFANQWRGDNEPPFPAMVDFIAAWNRLKLQPELRLVTASEAMETQEKEVGDRIPEYEGVWPDWWSYGPTSAPRELAASRIAKRYLHEVNSPLFGPMDDHAKATENDILGDLALSEEHTWASAYSAALPDSLDTIGQIDAKDLLALNSNARAAWLFSQRARTKFYPQQAGIYAINATGAAMSGWVTAPTKTLRGDFQSVRDKNTGELIPLEFVNPIDVAAHPLPKRPLAYPPIPFIDDFPRQMARFWVDDLGANSARVFELEATKPAAHPAAPIRFTAQLDEHGWPTSLQWPGMSKPLFQGAMGDFFSVRIKSPTPLEAIAALAATKDATKRRELQRSLLEEIPAVVAGPVKIEETAHTIVYTQELSHPAMKWLVRRLEVWKEEPRARIDVRFDRLSSDDPQIYYLSFELPTAKDLLPQLSEGGMPFVPYKDQIPGTCMDYFAIDGWAHYSALEGHWLWVSRDAPILSLGAPNVWSRIQAAPDQTNRLLSMVFNNTWATNYDANSNGVMDFQYDLIWRKQLKGDVGILAESLSSDPVALVNPVARENRFVMQDLFRP